MRYIKGYEVFESYHDEIMGSLLHVYGSIPMPKEKSSVVIKKIISASGISFNLGDNVDITHYKIHDKIRFRDYFDSLLQGKDIRGHNFEGLIAGVFNGELAKRGAKYDVTIDGKNWSIKFVDSKSKAPELGSYRDIITKSVYNDRVIQAGGLTRLFQGDDYKLKRKVWTKISHNVDGWILAYPDDPKSPTKIILNIVGNEDMFSIISEGCVVAPKGGYNAIYSLALSGTYRNKEVFSLIDSEASFISIPTISNKELLSSSLTSKEKKQAGQILGEFGSKIRPDVFRHIMINKQNVIKKLKEM